MKKIRGIKKIISLGQDELSESDISFSYNEPFVGKIEADIFIYSYENGGYDGLGVAVWRNKGKWAYQYLGHCSCNGPCEDIRTSDNAKFTLEQIKEILFSKDNEWSSHYKIVGNYLKKYK